MKKALISPVQPYMSYDDVPVELGFYVAQVENEDFPIAEPLFWTDCPDGIVAYQFYWKDGQFLQVIPPPDTSPGQAPVVL